MNGAAAWTEAIATCVAALAALIALLIASSQLGHLNKNIRLNGLVAVLQLESEINDRKESVDKAAIDLRDEQGKSKPTARQIKLLETALNVALENWFNAIDRLAFCILKEYLPEKDWRAEYRGYISNIVKTYDS